MSDKTASDILRDPDFVSLSRRKTAVTAILTAAEIALFFGFIGLIAFDARILTGRFPAGSATTAGIPIAVGVIFLSWVLTGVYVWWANNSYDALVRRVRGKIGA